MKGKLTKIISLIAVSITTISIAGGCAIFPEEADHKTSSVYKHDEIEYDFTYAARGDLEKTYNVVCAYASVDKEEYSFDVSGYKYDGIYVRVGDTVKKGDLLAEINLDSDKQELEELVLEGQKLSARITKLREEKELQVRKKELLGEMTKETEAEYEILIREAEREYKLLEEKTEAKKARVESGRLYAGMDGTVTFVKKYNAESRTSAGVRVVTVADTERALFKATTNYLDHFTVGDIKTVNIDKDSYIVRVVDPKEYGIEARANDVYFALVGEDYSLSDGAKGTITITLEKVLDAIYIPSDAITSLGDKKVVFYLNENGVRTYKEIVTGVTIDDYTEIISGVVDGEKLIIG